MQNNTTQTISLAHLFLTFLKIGSLAFGGYMALISVIENAVVNKHKLINHSDMLDGVSLANLLPGPMAVNVVAFTGYRIKGWAGALVAATAVILPSFLLMLALSHIYFNFGEIFNFKSIFRGFMPAVGAIVLSVAWRLGKKTVTGKIELLIVATATLILLSIPNDYKVYAPVTLIVVAGVIGYFILNDNTNNTVKKTKKLKLSLTYLYFIGFTLLVLVVLWLASLSLEKNSILYLTATFASMSLMLFGGGYVFIPMIGSIVVMENGWLTSQEFTDGIALGQVTPGPILISATFIGYKVAGIWGALFSTIGIFGVPAVLMIVVSHWFDFIRHSSATKAVMRGIHCAVIGMIGVAAFIIMQSAFTSSTPSGSGVSWASIAIFIVSILGLIKFNLDVIWVIVPAGLIGFFFL